MISLERKRSERSRKPFLLTLLDMGESLPFEKNEKVLGNILTALSRSTRETDVTGWYDDRSVVGTMFTEIGTEDCSASLNTLISRVSEALRSNLTFEQFNRISLSFHVFPEDWNQGDSQRPSNPRLYPDLMEREDARKSFRAIKRIMDIVGSIAALVLFSPVFLAIAIAIKATSRGSIFFKQRRIGQYGEPFVFLKFRTMHMNNDASIHEEYVKKLIAGKAEPQATDGNGNSIYKLTKDPRVTSVGAFLRRTSLDELPQFINVLQGKMSLVGPRPPVTYEVEAYDLWHRGRVLEAKPGITGLWQVNGRSRVKFDDMVRLDLQYARTWSPWMDIKILLRTPGAVALGEGAH
jgi:lipopolysaccharide/colanic/teichoic acid biosynthesis glycosyltransferase